MNIEEMYLILQKARECEERIENVIASYDYDTSIKLMALGYVLPKTVFILSKEAGRSIDWAMNMLEQTNGAMKRVLYDMSIPDINDEVTQ